MARITVKDLEVKVVELEKRIAVLESILKIQNNSVNTKTEKSSRKKSEPKESKKKDEIVVGNLIFCDRWVKTGTNYMSSKARYAIRMAIEKLGGVKLGKGNPVYEKCVKTDKYVQVYEFKTLKDCQKFYEEQIKRVD